MKPFEIFRPGRHTAMSGEAIEFSAADLSAIAASYDPAKHHAPIVVGHPKADLPAYGWVEKLEVVGDRLVATPADVETAFADLVSAKRFRKVSAAFYTPSSPNNPTPGSYSLRHVGFLGAQAPAVKGLKEAEFAADDDAIEFADWSTASGFGAIARMFRRIRDGMIADKGLEEADAVITEWDIEALQRAAQDAEPASVGYTDPILERTPMPTPDPAAPDAAALLARETKLKADEAAFAERQRVARAVEDAATVTAAVQAGRLPKALQTQAVALFAELSEGSLEFGEGDDAVKTSPRAAFADLLSKLPTPVEIGERAPGGSEGLDFSDPTDNARMIRDEMKRAADAGETISPADALERLKTRASA